MRRKAGRAPTPSQSAGPRHVAQRTVTGDHIFAALPPRPVAAPARRAHEHAVAAFENVLLAVVDAAPVDLHVAQPAGGAARQTGGGKARAVGHDAQPDRAGRSAFDDDVLTEAAAETAGPTRARAQALVMEEERALPLGDLDGRR